MLFKLLSYGYLEKICLLLLFLSKVIILFYNIHKILFINFNVILFYLKTDNDFTLINVKKIID